MDYTPDTPYFDPGHARPGRRQADRREKRFSVVYPDRRTGFDRRGRRELLAGLDGFLKDLRDDRLLLVATLGLLNVMNLWDLTFTLIAIQHGATERNPLFAGLLAVSVPLAESVKIWAMLAVSVVVYQLRNYRVVLSTTLLMLAIYGALIVHHLVGALTLT